MGSWVMGGTRLLPLADHHRLSTPPCRRNDPSCGSRFARHADRCRAWNRTPASRTCAALGHAGVRRLCRSRQPARLYATNDACSYDSTLPPLDDAYIWSLMTREWRRLFLAGGAVTVCVACNLWSPVLSGRLFQNLVQQRPFSEYRALLLTMGACYVVEPLLSQLYIRAACAAGEAVQAGLRRHVFRLLLRQRMEFYDRHRASELTTLLCQDLETVRGLLFTNVARDRGVRAVLEACGSVAVLSALAWRLGPVLAAVILSTAGAAFWYRARARAIEASSAAALSRLATAADEALGDVRAVRTFAAERLVESRWFGGHVEAARAAGLALARAKATLDTLNRGATHASLVALYALGGWLVRARLVEPGVLLTAIGFTFSLVFATQGLLQTFVDLRATTAALRRVRRVLSEAPPDETLLDVAGPEPDGVRAPPPPSPASDVAFSNVCFSYPARPEVPVLRDLSLRIPGGGVTALVGRSGSGKTTVTMLLQRLYRPGAGAITLDGTPISEFDRECWARSVASVPQEPRLFGMSVRDNIAFGAPDASLERVRAAAEAAHALGFIEALPEGFETLVGERGGQLSGGQRQRVALARALLREAPILILDEATSALDAESEAAVQAMLARRAGRQTVLVVAHRLSTVMAADHILVLDEGTVVESGTHNELLAIDNGVYARLVASQTTLFAEGGD